MTEELKQEAEAEADKVIIGSGMDRASVIHLKHLLVTMYMQGASEATKELEKENAELKTEKIPQLERRIASIRGSHSVDAKKLNARIEQVERLKKENAELSMKRKAERKIFQGIVEKKNDQLTKAKELLKRFVALDKDYDWNLQLAYEAEAFLKDNEVEK